jgi:hypothetical protein
VTGTVPSTPGASDALTGQLPAGGEVVGGSVGDDLGSTEARDGCPELAPLRSHRSPHPPANPFAAAQAQVQAALEADEEAVEALRDKAVWLSVRLHDLMADTVGPQHRAVAAAAFNTAPAVPAGSTVLHLRNAADTARTVAEVLDEWAKKMEAR